MGSDFRYKQNELLIYLNEQAKIARELGIDNGLEYITNIAENAEVFDLTDQRGADFLNFQWGYIAIEKKLQIYYLDQRMMQNILSTIMQTYIKKNNLQRLKSYYNELYNDSLENLPFFSEQDTGIGYIDIYSTKFSSNKINIIQIVLMVIVISFIVNFFFIIITLFNYKKIK